MEHCGSTAWENNCYLKRLQVVVRIGVLSLPARFSLHNHFLSATIRPVRLPDVRVVQGNNALCLDATRMDNSGDPAQ